MCSQIKSNYTNITKKKGRKCLRAQQCIRGVVGLVGMGVVAAEVGDLSMVAVVLQEVMRKGEREKDK